MCDSQFVPVYL